mgnify:CR=1 FL=1
MYRLHESAFRHQLFRLLGRHHNDLQVLGGVQMLAADFFAVPDQVTVAKLLIQAAFGATLQRNTGSLPAYPVSSKSSLAAPAAGFVSVGSMHPAGSSKRICLVPWRYWRTKNEVPVHGDGNHNDEIRHIIYIKRRDLRAIRQCAVIGVKIDPAVLYDRPGSVADPRFNRHNLFLLNQDKYNLKSSLRKRTDQFNECRTGKNAQADKR